MVGDGRLGEPIIGICRLHNTVAPALAEIPLRLIRKHGALNERVVFIFRVALQRPDLGLGAVDLDIIGRRTMSRIVGISTTDVGDLEHHVSPRSERIRPKRDADVRHAISV